MGKLYKAELLKYLNSWAFYLGLALLTVFAGFFFVKLNIIGYTARMDGLFTNLKMALCYIIPFLAAPMGREKASTEAVFPKFLAGITVLAFMTMLVMIYPIMLGFSSYPAAGIITCQVVGFVLLGTAFVAVGLLISQLANGVFPTFVITFCTLTGLAVLSGINDVVSSSFLSGLLWWVSPATRYDAFAIGAFDAGSVWYLFTVSALFATGAWVVSARREKELGSGVIRKIAIVLGAMLVINVPVTLIAKPVSMEDSKVFDVSKESRELLSGLSEDVNILLFYKEGEAVPAVLETAAQYPGISPKISMSVVDPLQSPGLVKKFSDLGFEIVYGTVIVETVDDFVAFDDNELYAIDTFTDQIISLAAESKLTNAIVSLTARADFTLGITESHGEMTLRGSEFERFIELRGGKVKYIDLAKDIPSDVDILMVIAPRNDFTKKEIEKVEKFAQLGKGIQIYRDYSNIDSKTFPIMDKFLENWGVSYNHQFILEGDSQRVVNQNAAYVVPEFAEGSITRHLIDNGDRVILPTTASVSKVEPFPTGVTWETLLTTSAESYTKADEDSANVEFEEGDIPGPYTVAAVSQRTVSDDKKSSGIFFATSNILSLGLLPENKPFVMGTLLWQARGVVLPSVAARDVGAAAVDFTQRQLQVIMVMVLLLPTLALVSGVVKKWIIS